MRQGAALLVLLVTLVVAGAAVQAQASEFPGCEALSEIYVECTWRVEGTGPREFPVPPTNHSLLFLDIVTTSPVSATAWSLCTVDGEVCVGPNSLQLYMNALVTAGVRRSEVREVDFPEGVDLVFRFDQGAEDDAPAASPAPYDLRVGLERLPSSGPSPRPAEIHLRDPQGDAPAPHDILSASFDDPYLDRAFIVARLRLASLVVESEGNVREIELRWSVGAETFSIRWEVRTTVGLPELRALKGGAWSSMGFVEEDNDEIEATLGALIPLRLVGAPAAGTPFTNLSATSVQRSDAGVFLPESLRPPARVEDEAAEAATPFRLAERNGTIMGVSTEGGGPQGASATSDSLPWYRAPLAPDNLLNTLQFLGSIIAVATTILGVFLVRRRRSRLEKLLREVEETAEKAAPEARAAALARLEDRYREQMLAGKLEERHYQVLARRIDQVLSR